MILAGLVAARFAHYTALAVLFGAATFLLFATPQGPEDPADQGQGLVRSLRGSLLWSSLAALATAILLLAFTAANMAGALSGMVDLPTLQTILIDTDFGRVWLFRLVAAALLVGWFAARRRTQGLRGSDWVVLLLAAAVLTTLALTGHAQIRTGIAGLVHRISDAGHLAAAAVWLGALPPFLFLLSTSPSGPEALRAGRLLQRFHLVGLLAVAALIATGLVNSWFLVGDVRALLTTAYGRLLLVKLALFAAMVGLAADNRLRLVPRLQAALDQGLPPQVWLVRLRAHVRWEFQLGLGVLLAVSVLGVLAPAIDAAGGL